MSASVLEIYTAPAAGAPMQFRDTAEAMANVGLEGDRYATQTGSYSRSRGLRDVTLVEIEDTWDFYRSSGIDLHPGLLRRNLVTEGAGLAELIGAEFRIGPVRLLGLRPCPPCQYLAKLLNFPELLKGFARGGGIYAQILEGGILQIGDSITR